jgi:hypothetical protein
MARRNSKESSGNGIEEAANAVAGAPNHLSVSGRLKSRRCIESGKARPMAGSFGHYVSNAPPSTVSVIPLT